jgi:hypothetical protein
MAVFIPTLGAVHPVQEKEILLCDVFDDLGCAQNPLTIVIQDCTILHEIYNN